MHAIANDRESILAELNDQFGVGLLPLTHLPFPSYLDDVIAYVPDAETRKINDDTLHSIRTWLKSRDWHLSRQEVAHPTVAGKRIEYLVLAPMVFVLFGTAYHSTRRTAYSSIMSEGLLPSSPERQNSLKRTDCDGNIYVCEHLGNPQDAGVTSSLTAHWWRDHLSKNNRYADPDWVILEIELRGLPPHRLHRDIWSASGVIVAGVDRIPPRLITLIYDG